MTAAFEVDKAGLAKKLASRPKSFIVYELLQNAWDEAVTVVHVVTTYSPQRRLCQIAVIDDAPDGFADLRSAYTLFRDSKKAADPEKRGRFELGEKLVIALALRAEICTTTGTVTFDGDSRVSSKRHTEAGSKFTGEFRMSAAEYETLCRDLQSLISPAGSQTFLNGEKLAHREPITSFEATLETVRTDDDGNLVPAKRKTLVHVYEPLPHQDLGYVYEMGIPVCLTGDRYDYDVAQRVPVNWERNNLPRGFVRTLRVEALNHLHDRLSPEEASSGWVSAALNDPRCADDAVRTIVTQRFGEKAVIYDPSDPEGTKLAVSQGYTVVSGGALPATAWENIRRAGALLPAGQVTPSPKPYSPDGEPEKVVPESEWTAAMRERVRFAGALGARLLGKSVTVYIVNEPLVYWRANFGSVFAGDGHRLCLNLGRLGRGWFAAPATSDAVMGLLIHEFGHAYAGDHLSEDYHRALCRLAAELAQLALASPEFFEPEAQ